MNQPHPAQPSRAATATATAASRAWRWICACVCVLGLSLSPLEAQPTPDAPSACTSDTEASIGPVTPIVIDPLVPAMLPSSPIQAKSLPPLTPVAPPRAPALPGIIRVAVPRYGAMPHADYNHGKPEGMSVALLAEILGAKGIRLEYLPFANNQEIVKAMCAGQVDVAMSLALTPANSRCIAYTDPYLQLGLHAVRRSADHRVVNGETLKRMRIAALKGSQIQVQAPEWFPMSQLIIAQNVGEAMRMVDEGKADLYFETPPIIAWQLQHGRYSHLSEVPANQLPITMREPAVSLYYTAPHARLPLLQLIDSELKRDRTRTERLRKQWLGEPTQDSTAQLTAAQREWLAKQPKLRVAIADNSAPLSSVGSNGKAEGILPDYLHMLEQHLGTPFEPVLGNGYMGMATAMSTGAADIALVPIGGLPGDHWVYSQPVDRMPTVIVTRYNSPAAIGLESLAGKRVSVTQLHRVGAAVLKAAPDARVVGVTTHAEGLRLVAAGKVAAHLGNLAVIDQVIDRQFGAGSFQVAPANMEDDIAFVVDERLAPLIPIINQQLAGLSEAERQRIHAHWISAEYNYGLAWTHVMLIVSASLLVIVVISAFYLRLRQESRRRELADRKLREVAGNLPGVVFKAQRGANGHIRFPYLTGRPELLFGVSAERLAAEDQLICSRVHPDDSDGLAATILEATSTSSEINADFRVATEDGSTRWVRISALPQHSPHHHGPRLTGYTGYFVDVTDAHSQAEALAAAKEQAESAARAKSSFLATMSHEIRTPMGGMIGMLELLGQSGLNHDQLVLLRHMQDSADSLQGILDDILDVSKIEAGHLRIEQVPMQPRVLADAVAMHTAAACRKKRLRLDVRVDEAVARLYLGDAMRLRQVLLNLLGNAVKFTERGGVWLDIRVDEAGYDESAREPLEPGLPDPKQPSHASLIQDGPVRDSANEDPMSPSRPTRLRIEIGDTGIGMNAGQIARVFEPFHQADDSISRRFGGTGLGLSICRSLVELMGGTIRIDSREGAGTRVITCLPLHQADAPAIEPMRLRVALAVDDPRRADALRQLLLAMGNELVEAHAEVDLLFVDGDGADTMRVVRLPNSPLPVDYVIDANPLLHLHVVRACARSRDPSGDGSRAAVTTIEVHRDARILVVEDNPVNRELIRRQLAQLGYCCDLYEDGCTALSALRKERYDLVLTDCQMPHMDGYSLAREIRAEERRNGGARLPIVAITASALPEQVDLCLAAGMDAYLIKPVHLSELLETLRDWLPGESDVEPFVGDPLLTLGCTRADASSDASIDADNAAIPAALHGAVPLMLRELPHDLARIAAAVAGGSAADAAAAVHRAIGSIALFDARLARAGQSLELRLLAEPMVELNPMLAAFANDVRGLQTRLAAAL